jgi:ATP-dependent exoDNAse (exonuclease V) alpha subunit
MKSCACKWIFLVLILFLLSLLFLSCSEEKTPRLEVRAEWAQFLDRGEQWEFANLVFQKPLGIQENMKYTEYQYRLGYITNRPVPKEEAVLLSSLEAAAIALGERNIPKEKLLCLLSLRYYYSRYSSLSEKEAKELAKLDVRYPNAFEDKGVPEKTARRIRDLLVRANDGLRTAE